MKAQEAEAKTGVVRVVHYRVFPISFSNRQFKISIRWRVIFFAILSSKTILQLDLFFPEIGRYAESLSHVEDVYHAPLRLELPGGSDSGQSLPGSNQSSAPSSPSSIST